MKLKDTTQKINNSGSHDLKVAYLFSGRRKSVIEESRKGEAPDDHLYGLLRISKYGIAGDYLELENFFSPKVSDFFRKFFKVYSAHLPMFSKLFSYDLIFAPTAYGTEFVLALLHFKKPKFVIYDFSLMGLIGDRKTFKQKVFFWMVSRSAGIVTLSIDEAAKLKEILPRLKDKIKFVPFGTDTDFFRPENVEEQNQILTVGFDPGRDYKTLFSATKDLGLKIIATRSRQIGKLENIPDHVTVNYFSWKDLVKEYSRSKIVVLPLDISSRINEAMGCSSLVQAMACGRPIIATRTPTTESYITSGVNGLLVDPKNENGMKEAIEYLLSNENKRIEFGRKAREFAEADCEAELATRNLAEFFKKVNQG